MALRYRVLGEPGGDNAVFMEVVSGKASHRLLFDCGQGCLDGLSRNEVRGVEHLLFSHFHMDHVAGFDAFFRVNCDRPSGAVKVWGPSGAIEILHHRFRGFLWNLIDGRSGTWIVSEVRDDEVESAVFLARDAFGRMLESYRSSRNEPLIREPGYSIEMRILDHGTPCLGYLVRERPNQRVLTPVLEELDLEPGKWIAHLKDENVQDEELLNIAGRALEVGALRERLLESTPGATLAVLTDFVWSEETHSDLSRWLAGCETLICEAHYSGDDADLAQRNNHLTSRQAASIAADAGVGRLVLFHVSKRYSSRGREEVVRQAREVFPDTSWPESW